MTFAILLVLAVLAGAMLLLATTRLATDAVMVAALLLLLAVPVPTADGWRCGVLTVEQAFAGFGNPAMLLVGVLFAVAVGLRETGAVDWIAARLFGRPRSERAAMLRLMVPTCALSAVLNNTPLVAMLIPAVQDWGKRLGIAPSRLLIPLSYAAILGGTCTLIGTSTNLVVAGLMATQTTLPPLRMFDLAWIGVPTAVVGIMFLLTFGRRLLPAHGSARPAVGDTNEYMLTLVVPPGSPLAGRTVDAAGLRNLPGCFLTEIERDGEVLAPVGPEQVLRHGDLVSFTGVVDAIRELINTRGLAPATRQVHKLDAPRYKRRLFETVVAPAGSLNGITIRQSGFRSRFHGAVLAVARNGERVGGRLGDVRLRGGDLLLVEADHGFDERARAAQDFLLVRSLEGSTPRQHDRAPIAVLILLLMITLGSLGVYPMLVAAGLAAGAMVATRCCSLAEARRGIDWSILVVIGASLGIGEAMRSSGASRLLADGIAALVGGGPWLALGVIYSATAVLTALIANSAAVALVFPIAAATAAGLGVELLPFAVAITMAGSASFATPIGYQTNLMVYGPGNYTFADFLRVGLPMNLVVGITTVALTPLAFPFHVG
ncbi:MAG: SLC13 family permease [Planctomycetes bacterium]|nr:SLC13 family permease [Planctomycetota bacterium]